MSSCQTLKWKSWFFIKDYEVKGGEIVEGKKGLGFSFEMLEKFCDLKDEIIRESIYV